MPKNHQGQDKKRKLAAFVEKEITKKEKEGGPGGGGGGGGIYKAVEDLLLILDVTVSNYF